VTAEAESSTACRYCGRAFDDEDDVSRHLSELKSFGLLEDHIAIHRPDLAAPAPSAETRRSDGLDWLSFIYRRGVPPGHRRGLDEPRGRPRNPWSPRGRDR